MNPISGQLLFDTNAARGSIRRHPDLVAAIDPSAVILLPLPVLGALLYGAYHAADPTAQIEHVRSFVESAEIVFPDDESAEIYGREKAALRRTGRMIPENDLWIAATALQRGLPLVTRDSHFNEIAGLTVIAW